MRSHLRKALLALSAAAVLATGACTEDSDQGELPPPQERDADAGEEGGPGATVPDTEPTEVPTDE